MSEKVLELQNIKKSFGTVEVIHGVNLEINKGEFIVFVGPSGCGKSTILRLIAGLDEPTSGDIILNNRRVNEVPASERGLSMVFQSYALYPHMSVKKNLSFGLENLRFDKNEIETRINKAAKLLQIEELLQRRPGQLSGGQRQRVAIGRSIVREPIIFLFDEPLSNLDAELRLQMRVELVELHETIQNTMIYVTHDQIEAMTMADKIVVLRDGKVEQIGAPLELYNSPANRFVAGFIGAPQMNFLKGQLSKGEAQISGFENLVKFDNSSFSGAVEVGIRPEDLVVSLQKEGDSIATVDSFEQLGSITYIYSHLTSGDSLTLQVIGQPPISRGQEIGVTLPKEKLHVFDTETGLVVN